MATTQAKRVEGFLKKAIYVGVYCFYQPGQVAQNLLYWLVTGKPRG
jgi:hypothetical protein